MDHRQTTRGYRAWVVLLLALLYFFYMLDRSAITIAQELIKEEFGLSDTQLGLLTGTLYGVSYALAGIPLGWAVDRMNRRNLLAAILTIWSTLTVVSGFATNMVQLALARIGVGAAEAGGSPAALSILSDLFPPERRGTVSGLFYAGASVGGIVSFLIGGWIAQHYGWRGVFIAFGTPGLILAAILLLTVREPVRKQPVKARAPGDAGLVKGTLAVMRFPGLAALYVATALYMLSVAGAGTWTVPYISRTFDLDIATIGLVMGIGAGVFGVIGQVGAGLVFDWANRFGPRGPLMVVAIGSVIHVIAVMAVLFAPSVTLLIAALCVAGATTSIQAGPTNAAISRIAPAASMGTAFALYAVISNVVGAGLGPLVVGALSDWLGGTATSLRDAMVVVALVQLLAVAAYIRAASHFARAVRAGEAALAKGSLA